MWRLKLAPSLLLLTAACSLLPAGDSPEDIAATLIHDTQVAADAAATQSAEAATDTPEPTATPIPPTDTPTPPPTETPTAVPEGPLSISDDFSSSSGIWSDCDVCEVRNGELRMGPFPVSGAFLTQWAICDACGMVSTYELSVDVSFIDGPSERGYGLILGLNDERFLTYEVTPWQTVDFWMYEYEPNQWTWVNGLFSGSVRAGVQTNTIGVTAAENASGRLDFSLQVNGRTPLVIFNQTTDPGWIGLTVFGHAVEVAFDNFSFQTDETPIYPVDPGRPTG